MTRAPALVLALLGTGGCSTVSGLFEDEPAAADGAEATQPTELVDFSPTLEVVRLWSTSVGGGTDGEFLRLVPAVDGERLYDADPSGDVLALSVERGRSLWQEDVDINLTGGPGAGEGLVVVGGDDGEVVALDAADGSERWRAQVTSEVLSAPRIAGDVVVVRSADGRIHGLDAASGGRRWSYDRMVPTLSLRGTSAPLIVGELAVVGLDNGRLVALDLANGNVVWEASVANPRGRTDLDRMVDIDGEPVAVGGVIYVATFQGRLAAVDASDGRVAWARDLSTTGALSADERHVYAADDGGAVWALDRATGAAVWRQEGLARRALSGTAAITDHVVVGDGEGYLHWLRAEDGAFAARVELDGSPILAAPQAIDGRIYAQSSEGELAVFAPR